MSEIELPVTFTAGPLHHDLINQQFAAVQSALNELLAYIEDLQGDVSPPDLSNYATATDLNAHKASRTPHIGMLSWGAGTALAGSDYVSGNRIRTECGLVTLTAGAGTFTYEAEFVNGVLSVQCSVSGTPGGACGFDNVSLADVDLAGNGTDDIFVTVIGW